MSKTHRPGLAYHSQNSFSLRILSLEIEIVRFAPDLHIYTEIVNAIISA